MTALSINLPEEITKESTVIAKKLGISRAEFIRRAIVHELEGTKKQEAQKKIVNSFTAMKKSAEYKVQIAEIIEGFEDTLPKESDNWWKKK